MTSIVPGLSLVVSNKHSEDNFERYLRCTLDKGGLREDYHILDNPVYRVLRPDEREVEPGRNLRKGRKSGSVSTIRTYGESFT